ncbi:MAG: ATP-binding cassette domain-containing protein [Clostridia bacterium]|nr:ATP-binding cassette domain-containing protein [Clostridia bacterium]
MAKSAISTSSLTKIYGLQKANDNVTMTIEKGDIYGLIGRNGAGKTTLMKMILGLTLPSSGSLTINGSTDLDAERKKIGSIIEVPAFFDKMTALQNLIYTAKLYGIKDCEKRAEDCLKTVGLYEVKDKAVKAYSLGMRQKLGIANALINDPEILILDEPVNGLDPVAIAEVRKILQKINKEKGTTILVSSHILGEMQKLAEKFGFISNGKFLKQITKKEVEESGLDLEDYSLKLLGVD